MFQRTRIFFLAAALLPCAVAAQEAISNSNATETPPVDVSLRETLPGMNAYYEPNRIERIGGMLVFKLFRYGKPDVADATGQYMLECTKREASEIKNERTIPLGKVLPGEDLYVVGKKLCNWDKQSLLDRALDQRQ